MSRMGKVALDRLGSSDDFVPGLHSLGDLNPDRRFILHFPEEKLIWSVGSGYGGNALLGQEVLRAANCELDGARRGLDGRAHADSGAGGSLRKSDLHGGRVSERLRQDESGHDGFGAGEAGLSRVDHRRRYRVDACGRRWNAARDQSRGGLLWSGARERTKKPIRTSWGRCTRTRFSRMWPSRPSASRGGRESTARLRKGITTWKGEPLNGNSGPAAHPNSRYTVPASQSPSISRALGRSGRACRSPRSFLAGGAREAGAAGIRIAELAARRVCGRDHGFGNDCGGDRRGGSHAARSHGDASFLRVQHGRLFRALAGDGPKAEKSAENFSCELVPAGRGREIPVAGYGENVRVLKWMLDRIEGRAEANETPIGQCANARSR